MISGVSFQPNDPTMAAAGAQTPASKGVQEAIQVLSLRLPKVVGAQGLAPSALMNAAGSNGNPRVDSVVNQVLRRMFPNGDQPAPGAPMLPTGDPRTVGQPQPGQSGTMPVSPPVRFDGAQPNTPLSEMMPRDFTPGLGLPRITPGKTPTWAPPTDPGAGSDTPAPPPAAPKNDPMELLNFLWRSQPPAV